jgi:FkbM family methyltransferase
VSAGFVVQICTDMVHPLARILASLGVEPVLFDVGAAGGPPQVWDAIAGYSTYVAFDPDARDLRDGSGQRFRRAVVLNKALCAEDAGTEVELFLTRSPHCSSTLPPDSASLANFAFADLFIVERRVRVPAITPRAALAELGLTRVDWFKTDSQGTDLRLFLGLGEDVHSRVLAVDMEPGLIHAYEGEDLFVDAHRFLSAHGFWLSNMLVRGSGRIHATTQRYERAAHALKRAGLLERTLKRAPGWCEVRYLRTVEYLDAGNFERSDYGLLAVFSLLDGHAAFALDVARAYEVRFGPDATSSQLRTVALENLSLGLARAIGVAALQIPGQIVRRIWRASRAA